MSQYITPWKCPECQQTWFKRELHQQLARGPNTTWVQGSIWPTYIEPGEDSSNYVYVCCNCSRILKELSE